MSGLTVACFAVLRPRALLLSLAAGLRLHSSLLQLGVANKDCQVDTILMMAERYPAALFPQNKDGDTVLDILFTEARRRHDEQNAALCLGSSISTLAFCSSGGPRAVSRCCSSR